MNFVSRRLSDLRVYENNPRNNTDAVAKVKQSILSYGYKVPIVIDTSNIIVAGHTRFAALLQIHEETGQYAEIQCIVADDLTDNQIKQFRIVDNQVSAIADWDFTKLRLELDSIEDFVLSDFGEIRGFETDVEFAEDIQPDTNSSTVKIKIGADTIEMSESDYHQWASYIIETKGLTVVEFVRQALELDPRNRQYSVEGV